MYIGASDHFKKPRMFIFMPRQQKKKVHGIHI